MSTVDIELRDVRKVYFKDRLQIPVLDGLSLKIDAGDFVALMGPSGSGKSTLLHVIGTLERPSSGVVRVGGIDAAGLDDRELSRLRADLAFISTPAVAGCRAFHMDDEVVRTKRAMMNAAATTSETKPKISSSCRA